jgi:hypothetical protein
MAGQFKADRLLVLGVGQVYLDGSFDSLVLGWSHSTEAQLTADSRFSNIKESFGDVISDGLVDEAEVEKLSNVTVKKSDGEKARAKAEVLKSRIKNRQSARGLTASSQSMGLVQKAAPKAYLRETVL